MTTTREQISPELEVILKKMCEMVGANYDEIDFKEKDWYRKHQWTIAQENEFIDWFTDRLNKNKVTRNEFVEYSLNPGRKRLRKVSEGFAFNYGWRLNLDV